MNAKIANIVVLASEFSHVVIASKSMVIAKNDTKIA
jgi:hypothetical protein